MLEVANSAPGPHRPREGASPYQPDWENPIIQEALGEARRRPSTIPVQANRFLN